MFALPRVLVKKRARTSGRVLPADGDVVEENSFQLETKPAVEVDVAHVDVARVGDSVRPGRNSAGALCSKRSLPSCSILIQTASIEAGNRSKMQCQIPVE